MHFVHFNALKTPLCDYLTLFRGRTDLYWVFPRSCLKWRDGLDTAAFIDPTKALYLLFSPRSWKGTFEMRQRKWLKTNQIELLMLLTLKIDLLKPCCCTISNNFQTRSLINVCSNSKSHSRPFPLSFCFASHKPAAACFHPFPWLQVGSRTQRNWSLDAAQRQWCACWAARPVLRLTVLSHAWVDSLTKTSSRSVSLELQPI